MIIKKIKPLFNRMVTTAHVFTKDEAMNESGLIIGNLEGTFKPVQTIIECGDAAKARGLKEGDLVSIDFTRYGKPKQKKDTNSINESMDGYHVQMVYEIPIIMINDKEHLFLNDSDVEYVIEEFEMVKVERDSKLIIPEKKIIGV